MQGPDEKNDFSRLGVDIEVSARIYGRNTRTESLRHIVGLSGHVLGDLAAVIVQVGLDSDVLDLTAGEIQFCYAVLIGLELDWGIILLADPENLRLLVDDGAPVASIQDS